MSHLIQLHFMTALLLAATMPELAYARGGDSGGGSNSVQNRVIEDFHEDISSLKGYRLYRETLDRVRIAAPEFARLMEAQERKVAWYNIPQRLKPVDEDRTGLPLTYTSQDCRQDGEEIFCDRNIRDEMPEGSAARQIFHELAMSLKKDDKGSRKVRHLVTKAFDTKATDLDIQESLAENEFGLYLSEEQQSQKNKAAEKNYLNRLHAILDDVNRKCATQDPLLQLKRALRNYFQIDSKHPVTYTASTVDSEADGAYSPFAGNANGWVYALEALYNPPHQLHLDAMSAYCGLPRSDTQNGPGTNQCREYSQIYLQIDAKNLNEDALRRRVAGEALRNGESARRTIHQTIRSLARETSFLNLMALQVESDKEFKAYQNLPKDMKPNVEWGVIAGEVIKKLEDRHSQLKRNPPSNPRQFFCSNVKSLLSEISRRLETPRKSEAHSPLRTPDSINAK